ncbi:hypothetical protein K0M31_014714 [Melipona bicolor]|uniref:Uncharacterized protein n=1 Tax=Melipona bicolor TaxID=60889 RepID=A0AA40FHM4_9HYME|nr:hypothetical protein K0M31_014714 [Melipona bicolor]
MNRRSRFVNSRYGSVEREEPGGNNARTNKDTAHFSSMFPWPIIQRIDEHVAIKIFSTLLGSPPLAIRADEAKAWRSIRCRKYWDCDLRALLVHVALGPNGDEFNARPITALPGVKSRAPEVQQDYRNGPLRFGNGFRPPLPFKTLERLGARISRSELSRSELSGTKAETILQLSKLYTHTERERGKGYSPVTKIVPRHNGAISHVSTCVAI